LGALDAGEKFVAGEVGDSKEPLTPTLSPSDGEREMRKPLPPLPCPLLIGWREGGPKKLLPELGALESDLFAAGAVGAEAGGDEPGFGEVMIENDETVVEADMAVGQFEIVDGAAREFGFNEVFQVVAPITETAAERKREVEFFEQFAAGHEAVEQVPGIAELHFGSFGRMKFAAGTEGAEGQERMRGKEGVAGLRGIE
jgi:hypothetical protein